MKKFSKISNFKVNSEEPHNEVINDSKENIKYYIHRLIEEFLDIRIEGPIDPILMGVISIDGKEEFTSALIEFMKQDEVKEQISLLENAKYNGIDNTLIHLSNKMNEAQTPSERAKHIQRVKGLVDKAGSDITRIKEETERQANRIKSGEKAYYRSVAAENLIGEDDLNKKVLKEISKIFLFRSQQLGYRK